MLLITGHSLRDVGAIIDRYNARTDKLAQAAVAKLEKTRGWARRRFPWPREHAPKKSCDTDP